MQIFHTDINLDYAYTQIYRYGPPSWVRYPKEIQADKKKAKNWLKPALVI